MSLTVQRSPCGGAYGLLRIHVTLSFHKTRPPPCPLLGRECRFSPRRPLDTAPEKMGPTRGERIFKPLARILKPFAPSSRLLLAAYRGAPLLSTLSLGEGQGEGMR